MSSELNDYDVINRYSNNLHLFKKFFNDFLNLLEKPIHISACNQFLVPKNMRTNFKGLEENELKGTFIDLDESIIEKYKLSIRESEVLSLTAHGYTAKQIANKLVLGRRTVESHIVNIKLKLNCSSKSELIDKVNRLL